MNDKLVSVLIGLARASFSNEDKLTPETDRIIIEGLAALSTENILNKDIMNTFIQQTMNEKRRLVPLCFECALPCGKNNDYDMTDLWEARPETRSLKLMILYGLRGLAADLQRAANLGYTDAKVNQFLYKGLFAVGGDSWEKEDLLNIIMELGEIITKVRNFIS